MVKIGLCGSHGSGKSALAQAIVDDLKECKYFGSVARSCPLGINNEATLESQTWIAITRIARELENQNIAKYLVCERTVMDDHVYLKSMCAKAEMIPNSDQIRAGKKIYQYDEYLEYVKFNDLITKQWANTYDFVFHLQPLKSIENDSVRPTDKAFQAEIDGLIIDELDDWDVAYASLEPMSIKDRLAAVKLVINNAQS